MKHLIKRTLVWSRFLVFAVFLIVAPVLSCRTSPEVAAEIFDNEQEIVALEEQAEASDDPATIVELRERIGLLEETNRLLEQEDLRRQTRSTIELLGMVIPLPFSEELIGAGVMALAPLLGSRGREHAGNFFKNLIPGMTGEDGSQKFSLSAALSSIAKMQGGSHTADNADALFANLEKLAASEGKKITVDGNGNFSLTAAA